LAFGIYRPAKIGADRPPDGARYQPRYRRHPDGGWRDFRGADRLCNLEGCRPTGWWQSGLTRTAPPQILQFAPWPRAFL